MRLDERLDEDGRRERATRPRRGLSSASAHLQVALNAHPSFSSQIDTLQAGPSDGKLLARHDLCPPGIDRPRVGASPHQRGRPARSCARDVVGVSRRAAAHRLPRPADRPPEGAHCRREAAVRHCVRCECFLSCRRPLSRRRQGVRRSSGQALVCAACSGAGRTPSESPPPASFISRDLGID